MEEVVERVTAFEIVEECLGRHTCTDKHRGAAQDLRIRMDNVSSSEH